MLRDAESIHDWRGTIMNPGPMMFVVGTAILLGVLWLLLGEPPGPVTF